jgi:hypothetical protein
MPDSSPSRTEKKLSKLREDYERSKGEIGELGHVVSGSLLKRQYSCGKPNCRCATEGILHGPYYQWTRKIGGKTVNINVDRASATMIKDWIKNRRKLRKLCARLEKISLAVLKTSANMEKI